MVTTPTISSAERHVEVFERHLGFFNDLMLMGTLSGVEMGLDLAGIPHQAGGVTAAMASLRELGNTRENTLKVAMA